MLAVACELASNRSPLLPIFLIVLVDILGMTIMIPLLPFYAEHFGASATQVGLLISTYAFCQLLAGPFLGSWSDRMGRRKPLLIVSQLGTSVGFLILASATSLWIVFLSRVIDGLTAGNLSLAQAYIADVTEPKDRARSFGFLGIAFGVGFLIGPAISGFLSQYGYTYPILAAAALSATSVICTATLLPKKEMHIGGDATGPAGKRLGLLDWGRYAVNISLARASASCCGNSFFSPSRFRFSSAVLRSSPASAINGKGTLSARKKSATFLLMSDFSASSCKAVSWDASSKNSENATSSGPAISPQASAYSLVAWSRTIPQLLGASTVNSLRDGRPAAVHHSADHSEGRSKRAGRRPRPHAIDHFDFRRDRARHRRRHDRSAYANGVGLANCGLRLRRPDPQFFRLERLAVHNLRNAIPAAVDISDTARQLAKAGRAEKHCHGRSASLSHGYR